jgi:hypothetical protein
MIYIQSRERELYRRETIDDRLEGEDGIVTSNLFYDEEELWDQDEATQEEDQEEQKEIWVSLTIIGDSRREDFGPLSPETSQRADSEIE